MKFILKVYLYFLERKIHQEKYNQRLSRKIDCVRWLIESK